jgi:hypothetical protein
MLARAADSDEFARHGTQFRNQTISSRYLRTAPKKSLKETAPMRSGANQFLAGFWQKGVDLNPLAPRKRGEGKGEGFPKSASSP